MLETSHLTRVRPVALITGASSGIGADVARELAGRGMDCFLAARHGDRLLRMKEELEAVQGIRVTLFQGDLTRAQEREELFELLSGSELKPDVLVNAAGRGFAETRLGGDPATARITLELNVSAVADICQRILPLMLDEGTGYILNIASVAGLLPLPGHARYSATKHYLLGLGLALNQELRGTGVSLTTYCPGLVDTGFFEAAGIPRPPGRLADSRRLARDAVRSLFARRSLRIYPLRSRLICRFYQLSPHWMKNLLLARIWKEIQLRSSAAC